MDSDRELTDITDEAIRTHGVGDEAFAAAYEAVGARRRAHLKTAIARLYEWHSRAAVEREERWGDWRQGFSSRMVLAPRSGCTIFFDDSAGPAPLLAALLPALRSGIPDVLVCHAGEGLPAEGVLAACELAGQERVAAMPVQEAAALAASHHGPERCAVILGDLSRIEPGGPVWRARPWRTVGVWFDGEGDDPDPEAIAFAQAGASICAMGSVPRNLPDTMAAVPGGFDDFLGSGFNGVFTPMRRVDAAFGAFCLVLGPGQEGCWLHPGLPRDHFTTRRVAWTVSGAPGDDETS